MYLWELSDGFTISRRLTGHKVKGREPGIDAETGNHRNEHPNSRRTATCVPSSSVPVSTMISYETYTDSASMKFPLYCL